MRVRTHRLGRGFVHEFFLDLRRNRRSGIVRLPAWSGTNVGCNRYGVTEADRIYQVSFALSGDCVRDIRAGTTS